MILGRGNVITKIVKILIVFAYIWDVNHCVSYEIDIVNYIILEALFVDIKHTYGKEHEIK